MYRLTGQFNAVQRVSDGAVIPFDEGNGDYRAYLDWLALGNTPEQPPEPAPLTQRQADESRYLQRAAVKDSLIATMAAENMGRVRSGEWTTAQLIALAYDPVMVQTINHMNTLSYEIAANTIAASSNPLLTPAIKAGWISKLQAHFYN